MAKGRKPPQLPPTGGRRKPRVLTPDEASLWAEATKRDKKLSRRKKPESAEISHAASPAPPREKPISPRVLPPPPAEREFAQLSVGRMVDLDRATAEKFRRGRLPVEATLDLHGHNRDQALAALVDFILRCRVRGRRCVCVVTGKGRPEKPSVLRHALPQWLNAPEIRPHILAFSASPTRTGGQGAMLVLLKKPG